MNKAATSNAYPLAVWHPQFPSRMRLYGSCVLLSALSAVPFVALLAYKDLLPAPYMTAWNWLWASFAAYAVVAGIFQLRIKVNRVDRLLCAVLSYLIWIAIASIGGAMVLADTTIMEFVVYFVGLKSITGILIPLYLFGPVVGITIARCFVGPQPPKPIKFLGCGQHAQLTGEQ